MTVVHWPVLTKQALSVDDGEYLTNNQLIQNPSWDSARRFLSEVRAPSTVRGYYQPLAMISLMLDYALGGRPDNLGSFHRTSLALHVANTALVILLLHQLFGSAPAAALAGLLFGLHPMTVEPIAWVADRKTVLSTFFALACLNLYIRYATHARFWHRETEGLRKAREKELKTTSVPQFLRAHHYVLLVSALLVYILALLSKPTSTPLPALMLLLDYWPLRRLGRRALVEKFPFLIVGAASACITYVSQSGTASVTTPGARPPLYVPLVLCHNVIFYLYKLAWPVNLSSHYAIPAPMSLAHPMVLIGVLGTPALLGLLLISLRWTRSLAIGWLFFFVAILPTMGVLGFTNVVAADKHAYLPMLGLLLPIACGLGRIGHSGTEELRKSPEKELKTSSVPQFVGAHVPARRAAATALLLGLALAEAWAVRSYLPRWNDSETLFRHMIALAPQAVLPHYGLGTYLKEQRRFPEAEAEFREALRLWPNYADAHNNLGVTLTEMERNDEAIEHYRRAVEIQPQHADARTNLGNALLRRGPAAAGEAEVHYRAALTRRPRDARAHMHLGMALAEQGRHAEAVASFEQAAQLDPTDAEIRLNLIASLTELGQPEKAIEHYRVAARLRPDLPALSNNLAWILATRPDPAPRDAPEALQTAQELCQRHPDEPQFLGTLAAALAANGMFAEAIDTARRAIEQARAQRRLDLVAELEQNLQAYQAGRPWREHAQNAP